MVIQKVLECMKQSAELLQRRVPTDAESALIEIEEALMISSFSENLREMKANVLFMVRVHEFNIGASELQYNFPQSLCLPPYTKNYMTNVCLCVSFSTLAATKIRGGDSVL